MDYINLFSKLLKYILLYFIISINLFCYEKDDFVKPDELEKGWGLFWTNPSTQEILIPYYNMSSIAISPDNKYLAFRDIYSLKILDLKTNVIFSVSKDAYYSEWSNDSKMIIYGMPATTNRSVVLYYIDDKRFDTIPCSTEYSRCSIGSKLAPDNYRYFANPYGYPPPDSIIFRVNFEHLLLTKKVEYELMEGIKYKYLPNPYFPSNNINYFISTSFGDYDYLLKGFDVTNNFDFNNRRIIKIKVPDTSWVIDACNTYSGVFESNQIQIGTRNDVYLFLSFRSKKELINDEYNNKCNPKYWDSSTIAARNASGWYRVDTSGNNLIQLVRSWVIPPGGISITGDGEYLYYGFLLPDTTFGIMRMNRFGKDKKLIVKIGKDNFVSVINEPENELNNSNSIISPNPASDYIEIALNSSSIKRGPGGVFYEIYNIFGEKITTPLSLRDATHLSANCKIDISNLAPGVYFIKIGDKFGKFIKI
jgi:hypothetical protein